MKNLKLLKEKLEKARPTGAVAQKEKVVQQTVVVKEAPKVQGTLQMIQKKDFFPSMNDWFRNEVLAFCKEQGWPVDVTYEAGYTGGWQFDIAAGPGVLIGKSDPDQALLRRINVGQSFVAKKGKDRVTCKLLCGIPKRGPVIEY